ncbi:phospho-N-acetylmuramoyl-pentapeptide-transferase [Candidatus Microgenomates bacterium]|nr:phospho-N-acetylmuramoyl-pentapeptide-transferase [Candidatus Microgenomates bacterium]
MVILLGFLIFAFLVNGVLLLPFINLLYKLRFQRKQQKTRDLFLRLTPIFDKFHRKKAGTPVGGGILIIITTIFLFFTSLLVFRYFWVPITSLYPFAKEVKILIFTFLSFGLLGLYDDIKKTFPSVSGKFFGLRFFQKLFLEILLALIIAFWLCNDFKIEIINLPFLGVIDLGLFYIPFAVFVIVSFTNAFNITDGLDGLASGLLMIALFAFWIISVSILDTPLSTFIALWLGGLIAFLYFNITPARIFLGDVGALSFGATFAVIGLLLGKAFTLVVIGGLFVIEAASSLIQILGKRFLGRRIFKVAPFHLYLQEQGWEEPKIVFRAWLAGVMLAVFGLFLAMIR